jgi:GNAT superfamily N-acetyltransferase
MYKIKLVQENNIPELSRIMARVFTEADADKPWDEIHTNAYLQYWYKKQPDMFWGAFNDADEPIGVMAVNIKPWRTGVRCTDGVIFVDTKYQKQGIAKSLFKKVLEEAIQKYQAKGFEAITFAEDTFPLTWYKKIGIDPDEHAVLIKGDCEDIIKKLS